MKRILLLCAVLGLTACTTVEVLPEQLPEFGELRAIVAMADGRTLWEYINGPDGAGLVVEFDAAGKFVSSRRTVFHSMNDQGLRFKR